MKPEESGPTAAYAQLMSWADKYRKLKRAHQRRQPEAGGSRRLRSAPKAMGLCRTEHMFFDHIQDVPRDDPRDRPGRSAKKALAKLLPFQRGDFAGLFKAMNGKAGDDPPARPAAPRVPARTRRGCSPSCRKKIGISARRSSAACEELHESNPMLGHRGCRLGIVYSGNHARCRPGRSSKRLAT